MATYQEVVNYWIANKWPNRLMKIEHNKNVLNTAVGNFVAKSGGQLSVDDIDRIVSELGDASNDPNGQLVWIPATGAAAGPPHQDVFPSLKNVEDVIEYIKTVKIEFSKANQINELLAFYKQHGIHRAEVETVSLTPEQQIETDLFSKARTLLANLNHRDVGSVGSTTGQGAWTKIAKFKTQYGKYIDICEQKKIKGALVLKRINDEIAELRTSSIR